MPELAEVETISQNLRRAGLIGCQVRSVELFWPRTLATPDPQEFQARLPGQRIVDLERRAKFLLIRLSQDVLMLHLRMSGDLSLVDEPWQELQPSGQPRYRFVRLALGLLAPDGRQRALLFSDARKFGRVWLVADPAPLLANLGPEPLDPALTPAVLMQILHPHRRAIKTVLLDQHLLAGLGNIYSDESLHLAKIHPQSAANRLNLEQVGRLLASIRQTLQEGITRHGASIDWVYRGGDFQNHFRVYQRTGEPCPECGTPIVRLVVGQRGTHICPNCQQVIVTEEEHD
jgi:formamidopyrimidine-DNA glycosylase